MMLPLSMNAQTKPDVPEGYASVTLTAGDVWEDGSGYQMLLDADATAYGSIIPETGPLTASGDASAEVYAEFEYKIPENADGACATSNIVINNSITILIPAGVYDWCITNPTPDDRIWIASENGNVGGRANDYEFRSGVAYEFTVSLGGSNDQVDVVIDDPTAPVIPTDVTVTPTATTGGVVWVAGENNATWNLRWRPWVDPANLPVLWDLPLDGYEEQIAEWSIYDADGDGNSWGLAYSNDSQDDICFYSASYYNYQVLTPDNWLITPEVGLGGTLRFKVWNRSSSYLDKIMVYVCTNPDFASTDEFVAISDFIEPTATSADEALEVELDLSAYEGTGCIAFRHYDCEDKWSIYIDDIEVIPANPAVASEWTVVEGLTSPAYTIENLTPETQYEVQVMANNELGVSTSWTSSVLFTTLKRFIKHIDPYTTDGGYYLIASPIGEVDPENVTNMLSNNYDLYYFDQSKDLEWINYKAGNFNLEAGKGYLYANSGNNDEGIDLFFDGLAYSGNADVTLVYDETANLAGWNLVGNPFADTAYLADNRPFYIMDGDGSEIIPAERTSIEAMEGVFVIAERADETLTFTTTKPTGKSAQLVLNITGNRSSLIDRAIVRFDEGNDMPKLQLNPNHTKLYMPVDNKDYAVVNVTEMGEMPVSFKAEENATYTLSFSNENVEFGYLHLIDNMTGADIDLLVQPSYSFEAKPTDNANRFELVFSTVSTVNEQFASFVDGTLIFNNEGNATMNVFDITGRLVNTQTVNGSCQVAFNAVPGVYMIQLVNGNDVKTQKIVVKK